MIHLVIRASILLFPVLILSLSAGAQRGAIDPCGTDEYTEERLKKLGIEREEYEHTITESLDNARKSESTRSSHIDTIPVVVHVIHDGGEANISYEQVRDGIRVLNEDFRRMNADSSETRPVFDSLAADSEIRFRLARSDPNGNCSNGVTRTRSELTHDADNRLKSLIRWPTDRYLNFWLADDLGTSGDGTLLGYAQFPWSGIDNTYGIVQRHDRFGTIGTSNSEGRTATHEVGHCLGLFHTFQEHGCGNDCANSGDRICDTPPTDESTYGCDKSQNTCSNDTVGPSPYTSDVKDQIENYMSYDACQNMFSKGQKQVMKGALGNISGLKKLVSDENMKFTGMREDPLCKVDFRVSEDIVCTGEEVEFTDVSYHKIEGRTWTFHGGDPFFAVDKKKATTTFKEPGLYDADLTVHQGNSSLTEKKKDLIRVIDHIGEPAPLIENMEDEPVKKARLFPRKGHDGMKWGLSGLAGASGTHSMVFENYFAEKDHEYEFETSSIDASGDTVIALEFKAAYRKRESGNNDRLEVYATKKCNEGWSQRGSFSSTQLSSEDPTQSYYEPGASDWNTYRIETSLNNYNTKGLRFKFRFITDGGNNIYIDDINVAHPDVLSTQDDIREEARFNLYPNPARDAVTIETGERGRKRYKLMDATGRTLRTGSFEGRKELGLSSVSPGIHFLQIQGENGRKRTKKLVVR